MVLRDFLNATAVDDARVVHLEQPRSSCGSQSSVQQPSRQELPPLSLPFAATGWPWMHEVQAASQHTLAAGQQAGQQQRRAKQVRTPS